MKLKIVNAMRGNISIRLNLQGLCTYVRIPHPDIAMIEIKLLKYLVKTHVNESNSSL